MVKKSEKVAKGKISARCDHIAIFTNNAQRLLVFYVKIMGFRKEREEILPESIMKSIFGIVSECRFITLAAGGARIELFQPLSVRLKKRRNAFTGYNHWGYVVDDREKFCQDLEMKKVHILKVKRGDHFVYFVRDPDGNRIEIRYEK